MDARSVLLIVAAFGMTPALAASSSDDLAMVQEAKMFLERLLVGLGDVLQIAVLIKQSAWVEEGRCEVTRVATTR
jgi:hypothetical protein